MSNPIVEIEKYFKSTSQYPLLAVVSPDEYRYVLKTYSDLPKIKVSNYCVGDDKEPDIGKLKEDVKAYKGNCLLLGLGDYLVSKGSDAKIYLTPYKSLILHPQSHVAILLSVHMYPVVKEIIKEDLRAKQRVVLPAVAPQVPTFHNNKFVYGIKAYLDACEKGEFISNVKTERKIPNAIVINPECAFDELKHRFPNEFNKLSQSYGTADNWSKLLIEINQAKKNILQYLEDQRFVSPEYIFLTHAKFNDFRSWLFFIWLKLQKNDQSYLGLVASKTQTFDNLLNVAKNAILDISVSDSRFSNFYKQRKLLLKDCSDADMADFIPLIYCRGADRIAYLTDNTKIEKQAIIVSLGEGAKDIYLKTNYPDLYSYLQDYYFDDNSLTNYFIAYKKCKVYNKIDAEFAEVVKKNAISRPYNSLPSRSSVFSRINPDKTLLIFLDAMGVEFLGYIKDICSELKLRFELCIARANLPTITSTNKEFFVDWKGSKEQPIKGIDDLKHNPERGYDYYKSPYPIHLSEELEIVREALERAATKLQSGEYRKVIIASDHGASRLAVISPDQQIDCGVCEPKSSGRYCYGDIPQVEENIAIENKYSVVADYSRFKGSRAASVEVHGGATLEEVVVPIIKLTLANRNIQVVLEKAVIEVSYKKDPELLLIITPDCDAVTTSINGIIYKAEKLEKSHYRVVMPNLKKGTYTIDIFENQNKIASKEFTVKSKGFTERDIF